MLQAAAKSAFNGRFVMLVSRLRRHLRPQLCLRSQDGMNSRVGLSAAMKPAALCFRQSEPRGLLRAAALLISRGAIERTRLLPVESLNEGLRR